jgi:hypothetical protein
MRALFVIILLAALVPSTLAFAEIQTFTTTHTYVLGDDDSRNSARQKCLAEAKRKILEQVGVYLESKSELITSSQSTTSGSAKSPQTTNEERQQITEQINTLTAGVMRSEVVKEEFGEANGRLQITLTLKSEVDPDDIRKQLAERRVDQKVRSQVVEQAERLKKLEESLRAMMEEMRTTAGDAPRRPQKQNDILPTAADLATIRERANAGDAQAQNLLGNMYVVGKNLPQDYATARGWYEQAAAQGDAMAQYNLGLLYANGQGMPRDYATARQWWEQAAAQGNAMAQSNLGVLYENGQGVPQDYATARQWYEKSAAQGYAQAQTNLGVLYAKGHGVPQDYALAAQWYEKSAAQGNAQAQTYLGVLYENGQGVPQDYAKARQWYEKSAAQGYAQAQYNLGVRYAKGHGVPQDYAKALGWFEQAAIQGDAMAQFNLGMLYAQGQGVPKDNATARQWWEKAAAQGYADAQYNLGVRYAQGQGVPQDDVRSYMLFSVAAASSTGDLQKNAAGNRDKVARRMTPAQIAEAQRLAQQCQTQQFKGC